MPTLLIFAHECAPFNRPQSTVGAQRPAQFAKYLPAFGWRAVVICCDRERRDWPNRAEALAAAREEARRALVRAQPGESVIIATPSLAYDGLRDYLWRTTFNGDKPKSGRMTAVARRLLTEAKFYTGDWSQNWQPCARAAAEVVAETLKIDVALGEHGPDAGMFLGRWFAEKYGVAWVADFRDPMAQGYQGLARLLYARAGKRLVVTAAGTVNVTPFWTELDKQMFGRPAWCVTNGFDEEEYSEAGEPQPGAVCEIAYTGNIIPPQRLDIFLEGLKLAGERLGAERGKLRFAYRGYAQAQVAELAERIGVADMVQAIAPLPREESLALLRQTQVLLLLSFACTPQEDVYFAAGFYPAKTFEYFGARRPILCVPGDGKMLDALLLETRAGAIATTPEAVAGFLQEAFRLNAAGQTLPYNPDPKAVARFSRRNLAGRLASVLNHIVGLEDSPAMFA